MCAGKKSMYAGKKWPESSFHPDSIFHAENSRLQRGKNFTNLCYCQVASFLVITWLNKCGLLIHFKTEVCDAFRWFCNWVTGTVLSSYFVNIFVKQIRLMFPHDPSTPIRIRSPESRPNFLLSFFRVKTFTTRSSPPRRPPAHLRMRRSFFSGFLTKMELKRWKTHRPSHSRHEQNRQRGEWCSSKHATNWSRHPLVLPAPWVALFLQPAKRF